MNPEQWQQVKHLFEAALKHGDPAERRRFLERAAPLDATVRREVLSLLAADAPDSFLEKPPVPAAALEAQTAAKNSFVRIPSPGLGRTDMARQTRCAACFTPAKSERNCSACEKLARDRPWLALPQGTLLGDQYLVGCVLGAGGFGITYLAWDTRLATRVAIKEYFAREFATRRTDGMNVVPNLPQYREALQYGLHAFLREARSLGQFDHPQIVRVRTYFEANATGYIVMDYYDGLNLQALADKQRKPFSETEALAVILPVLAGLQAVHARGLLHRDIKPSNIYLADRVGPVLLDFGTARMAASERSRDFTVILTPGFAPPEQYHSKGDQGPWTDVYACAATLYYLLSGATPPSAPDRLMGKRCMRLQEHDARLSTRVCAAVEQGLAMNPEHRQKEVREFQAQLLGTGNRSDRQPAQRTDIVECVHCGTRNRVRSDQLSAATCGRCDRSLVSGGTASADSHVRCPRCGARNRLRTPAVRNKGGAICGKCGDAL